jgi:GH43 family beta-xylosidase
MRRMRVQAAPLLLVAAIVALWVAGPASATSPAPPSAVKLPPPAAPGAPLHYTDPLRDGVTGRPLSCPDPSVIRAHRGRWNFFLFCTSDNARNAFPIYMSTNLVRWYPDGDVFPSGHQPAWAEPSDGHTRRGIFWAPSIYRIDGRWVLYFAAAYNPASGLAPANIKAGRMVLGVATSPTLAGPWQSELLYYNGEFNADNGPTEQELTGGDIDPGMVYDPETGMRYLFWAQQREAIWEAPLSADGLTVSPDVTRAFGVSEPWECAALCTIEGPQPFYAAGRVYVLFSAASTWNASYVVGVASAVQPLDPADPFAVAPDPILKAGNGFLGPGGESDPVTALNGRTMILYHALTHVPSSHDSAARLLMLGTVNWVDGEPLINQGVAR